MITAVAAKSDYFVGSGERGAEFLRLNYGPLRQIASGKAGGKSHVVLNLRTAARLPARSHAIEQEGFQSFRRAIYSRRQSGWPGTHDNQIVYRVLDRFSDPETICQLPIAGVAQDSVLAANDDRRLVRLGLEILE